VRDDGAFFEMGGQGYRNRRAPKTLGAASRKECVYSSFHREAAPLPRQVAWTFTRIRPDPSKPPKIPEIRWPYVRRLVLVRHRVADKDRAGGKKLIDEFFHHVLAVGPTIVIAPDRQRPYCIVAA
jgi:hypothetical protein